MPSQPSLNTFGELLHPPTVDNDVGHEDRLLLNNVLNAFPSSQKNKLLEALYSVLNVLEQNHGISKDVADVQVPFKNVFDTLNDISKPSSHKDAHEINNDDKPVEEVQVDSSAIGKVSSGYEKTSLKASNILSSP
ncbi:hypothetical protein LWI29_029699 [Acer saccharum]|uniref:Uncharacterized protein n=1 Tax=Acer saccharum TaxID=4024 RepID=A0AA39RMJ8_ACESA|nr:hypothetical protein LWI29_029699 [Acer saccharum]